MNDYLGATSSTPRMDLYYFWDQFHPILGALVILLLGWIIALAVASGVKVLLNKLKLNQHFNPSLQRPDHDIEQIISRIIFWFILIIAVVASLNVLNLTAVSAPFSNMVGQVLVFIPQLIAAIAIGLLGWLVATLVRAGLIGVLNKTQLDEKLSKDVGVTTLSHNIAEIAYWLILLLFLPMVLSILGLTGLLLPVQSMLTQAINFLPNLFMAGVILFAGYILAKIVRGIVEGLSNSVGLQIHAEKLGVFKSSNLPKLLGSFVFAVVMITTLIVAFDALGVQSISQPATAMLNQIMSAIPNILAAVIILIIAYVVSKFVAQLVTELLAGTGIDRIPEKVGVQRFLGEYQVSKLVGYLIILFTMLFAVSEAADRLQLDQVSQLISMFIQFGANILLGAIILVIGFWLANGVAEVVQRGQYKSSNWLAGLVRVLIMGLVIAMGLRAMGIADSIVNLAFGLTLGGVAVAFALAFGLGGREPAQRLLTKLLDKAEQQADSSDVDPKGDNTDSANEQTGGMDLPAEVANLNLHPEHAQTHLHDQVLQEPNVESDPKSSGVTLHLPADLTNIDLNPQHNQSKLSSTEDGATNGKDGNKSLFYPKPQDLE